jgi:hypothetical protein
MPASDYKVVSTQQYAYQDQTQRLVQGYRVYVFFPAFNETHFVLVPTLAPEGIKAQVDQLLKDRKNLATL